MSSRSAPAYSHSHSHSPPGMGMSNERKTESEPLPSSSRNANTNIAIHNTNNSLASNHPSSTIESTYTSLIQQYLSLLQYENAIFLAERFVAYNSTPYSNYLLAMCYYKHHKVQHAKRILLNRNQKNVDVGGGRRGGRNGIASSSNSNSNSNSNSSAGAGNGGKATNHNQYFYSSSRQKQLHFENECNMAMDNDYNSDQNQTNNNNNNNSTTSSSVVDDNIIYLLAKCNVDLELWKEAEDTLLKNARTQYQNYKKKVKEHRNKEKKKDATTPTTTATSNNAASKVHEAIVMANTLEEYLFELVSRKNSNSKVNEPAISSSLFHDGTCLPIPNGAAGLHLLGIVCQRTMRKDKASLYYTLALKVCYILMCISVDESMFVFGDLFTERKSHYICLFYCYMFLLPLL